MKKVYESPVMEIMQFAAQENLASGADDNSAVWPENKWPDPAE